MRLLETYSEDILSIEGRTFPTMCLLEDEDGIGILVVPDLDHIPSLSWVRAHASGARFIAQPPKDGGPWVYATVEWFAGHREENHLRAEFSCVPEGTSDSFPTYRIVLERRRDLLQSRREQPRAGGFVSLHAHSEFSALDGMSKVQEMVDLVVADDQPALAITDHGICASHPHLQIACQEAGIKPIFGCEANFTDDRLRRGDPSVEPGQPGSSRHVLGDYRHLILWAANDTGLRNLWGASTEANATGFYGRPRMDWATLERHSEGVMASTACLRGPVAQRILAEDEEGARAVLARLLGIYGDRLYAELHTNHLPEQKIVNAAMIALAHDYSIPLIAVTDAHYPTCDDRHAHQVWIAAQTNSDLTDDADLFVGEQDYHMLTQAEVRKALDDLPANVVDEAIANTVAVADRCSAEIRESNNLPMFSKVGGVQRDVDRLVDICTANWERKVKGKPKDEQVYLDRFEREARLIIDKGFCGYFLMVWDYVKWAKDRNILVGPGRGSGGGSLIAYLMDITEVDPVDADLLFERFLTEGRTALPDFDIDFPTSKRDELTRYAQERWGEEQVIRIGTHLRLKNRGVIRDLARVLKSSEAHSVDYRDVDALSAIIDEAEGGEAGLGLSWDALNDQSGDLLEPYREKYPEMFSLAGRMVGRLKSYGKHAAGLVISTEEPLTWLPLRWVGAGEPLVSEFDMDALEFMGLVKFDLLTLRTLDTVQQCLDLIEERSERLSIYDWREEFEDTEMWDEIGVGHTLGIFQIETKAGTRLCKDFRPRSLAELSDVITLVRPGPMRSGLTARYLRRRNGLEPVDYPDPRLEEVLSPTQGVPIYQEQIMAICMVLGGYTSSEADKVRKILGKKKVELVEAEGRNFASRCVENGMAEEPARLLWDQMAEFAKYAFGKAHAYAYAMIGVWTAWLKTRHGAEAMTSLLSTVKPERLPEFINESRRLGFRVQPPDVNLSGEGFSLAPDGTTIRYGLDSVKGVGGAARDAITQHQPFTSMEDFTERKGGNANAGIVKILARVGALDSLSPNRKALEITLERQSQGEDTRCVFKDDTVIGPGGLPCTFDWDSEPPIIGKRGKPLKVKPLPKRCTKACRNYTPPAPDSLVPDVADYTEAEIRDIEMEMLGVHLSSTPFDAIPSDVLAETLTAEGVEAAGSGEYVVAAVIAKVKKHTDRNGRAMAFLGLNARDGELDVVVFSDQWAKYRHDLRKDSMAFLVINKTDRGLNMQAVMPV
jgi:DNA polymerase-3 subunit alpha